MRELFRLGDVHAVLREQRFQKGRSTASYPSAPGRAGSFTAKSRCLRSIMLPRLVVRRSKASRVVHWRSPRWWATAWVRWRARGGIRFGSINSVRLCAGDSSARVRGQLRGSRCFDGQLGSEPVSHLELFVLQARRHCPRCKESGPQGRATGTRQIRTVRSSPLAGCNPLEIAGSSARSRHSVAWSTDDWNNIGEADFCRGCAVAAYPLARPNWLRRPAVLADVRHSAPGCL